MTTTTDTFRKEIKFDRLTGDFACYLDGDYKGHAANYSDGEVLLDQIAYDLLVDGVVLSALQLDGGSEADACAATVVETLQQPVECDAYRCRQPATHDVKNGQVCCYHYRINFTGEPCGCTELVAAPADNEPPPAEPAPPYSTGRPYPCAVCHGPHHVQHCPNVRALLFKAEQVWFSAVLN